MKRRRTCSVAIIGPDGAGKTTLIDGITNVGGVPTKRIYMGEMLGSANVMLPTTRLILSIQSMLSSTTPDRDRSPPPAVNKLTRSVFKKAGLLLKFMVVLAEAWYRLGVARWLLWSGYIVLFDRHFHLEDIAHRAVLDQSRVDPLTRLRRFLIKATIPRPDLVIYLDAPASILFARKGERTIEVLERWRQGYVGLAGVVSNFAIVDATQSEEVVRDEVIALIGECTRTRSKDPMSRRRWHHGPSLSVTAGEEDSPNEPMA